MSGTCSLRRSVSLATPTLMPAARTRYCSRHHMQIVLSGKLVIIFLCDMRYCRITMSCCIGEILIGSSRATYQRWTLAINTRVFEEVATNCKCNTMHVWAVRVYQNVAGTRASDSTSGAANCPRCTEANSNKKYLKADTNSRIICQGSISFTSENVRSEEPRCSYFA